MKKTKKHKQKNSSSGTFNQLETNGSLPPSKEYNIFSDAIRRVNMTLAKSLVTPTLASYVDKESGNTALILACSHSIFTNIAMALIATRTSNYGQQNIKEGNTALILACENNMPEVALALIATGQSNPGVFTNYFKNTALIHAIRNNMTEVALALIATGESNSNQKNSYDDTALILACENKMEEVALALIPGELNFGKALILACYYNIPKVALALIATGKSNPGKMIDDQIPLIWACKNKMTDVVLALIATGESRPELVKNPEDKKYLQKLLDKYSMTSFIYAAENAQSGLTDWDYNDINSYFTSSPSSQNAGKNTKKHKLKKTIKHKLKKNQ